MKLGTYRKILKACREFDGKLKQGVWGVEFRDGAWRKNRFEGDCACAVGATLAVSEYSKEHDADVCVAGCELVGLTDQQLSLFIAGFDDTPTLEKYTRSKYRLAGRRIRDTLAKEGLLEL